MSGPVVLFCAGATKAGTSWLHRYLSDHPDCHMGPIKELHYFDALDFGQIERQIAEVTRTRQAVLDKIDGANGAKVGKYLRQIAGYEHYLELLGTGTEDIPGYLAYLNEGREGQHLVADITPAYALLSQDRLKAMGRLTPNVRFLYLMRDPVARLWSHIRMMAVRRDPDRILRRAQADRIFEKVMAGQEEQIASRSDYKGAVEKLRRAVDPSRVMVAVAEDMFEGQALAPICAFLGIAHRPAKPRVVHRGQALDMLDAQRARARDWLADQYDYAGALLGGMPARWQAEFVKV